MSSQILRVQVPSETAFDALFDRVFLKYTRSSDLIAADSYCCLFLSWHFWCWRWGICQSSLMAPERRRWAEADR
jgi:hypothetical protein